MTARRERLGAVLVLLIAVAVYLPGLPGTFVYDDYRLIVRNEGLKRPFDPARAFLRDYYASDFDRMGLGYYRPVAILSNEIDYRRGGGAPLPFHATNIAIHVASTALLMLLARSLSPGRPAIALGAGVIFAVHPAHAESVAFISGRVDPLATMFGLAALVLHLGGEGSERSLARRALAGGSWLLALLSKEMAITVPVVAALIDAARDEVPPWKRDAASNVRRYGGFAVAAIVYLVMRRLALGAFDPGSASGAVSVVRPFATIGAYLTWLVVPGRGLHLEPPAPAGAAAATMSVIAIAAAASVVVLWRRGVRLEAALAGAVLVTLLPVAQLRVLETAMSDRFLYLPSVFAAILIALALGRLPAKAALGAGGVLVVLYATMLTQRAALWRDEIRLWTVQTEDAPQSVRAWVSLAHAYVRNGDREAARRVYEHAGTLGLDRAALAAEMASTLGSEGGRDEEQTLVQALQVVPGDAALWQNLGFVRLGKGDTDGAHEAFRKATELVPERSTGWLGLAFTELRRRNWVEARQAAERAEALDPTLAIARAIRGECLWRLGDPCGAVGVLDGVTLDAPEEAAATQRVLDAARRECGAPSK